MKKDNFVLVYKGAALSANIAFTLLKDSGIQSAVKIDNSVSSYKMLSTEDEVYVHEKEADEALLILKDNLTTE